MPDEIRSIRLAAKDWPMSIHNAHVSYFGDSLTDVGVIFGALVDALTEQILPVLIADLGPDPTPEEIAIARQQAGLLAEQQALAQTQGSELGPQKAVTNEFTHATYFADLTGHPIANFANAGARALGSQEPFGDGTGYDSNLGAQLDRFVAASSGTVSADSKAVLFIGLNDFRDIVGDTLEDPDASILEVLGAVQFALSNLPAALEDAARRLSDAGIGTVYFGTLPSPTFFPGADDLDSFSAGLSDIVLGIYNGLLTQRAQSLRSEGIDVQIIDYAALSEAIAEDPSGFGIVAERSDLLIDGSGFDSDQVGFWDPIHPAEAVHQAWGAFTAFVMEGGSTSSLSDFGTLNIQDNGNNAVFANGGNDTVIALDGDDIVFGGTGADRLFVGEGDDIASGGAGDDILRGKDGDDLISGGSGNDTVYGGSGNDVLIDGLGSDVVRGGWGDDTFIFIENILEGDSSPSQDYFRGGIGSDTLYLVLDAPTFGAFETDGAASVLDALGISASSIETVIAINGRDQVEDVLGDRAWFQEADYWGLVPAPTDVPAV
ncbi:SGNH/GDSL hydrolase family protein [Sulfitobacter aestuarii]|uniref:SGNH/GDSL hydrolase family protein n=1 Tax=Sulfitobacter aestuarii TaxID=2161676 RepID=A0ABW5U3N7_9RHOB